MLQLESSAFFLLLNILQCRADDEFPDGFEFNPILARQPQFARSLPVQILLIGIVFTLTAVLLIHLIFTAQYHWPLAPVNYALQLSGVLSLFISLVATLQVILSRTMADSQDWPYMLTYLSITIPPNPQTPETGPIWNTLELSAWHVMDATISALVQITHIQFLTLLYPSRLEQRLILFLLGPLAVLSASMELLQIYQNVKVVDIADTVKNTCNAALSLLFTAALMIWGFLVNRKQAWRTDGGTAAFGAGALTLAVLSTALNFVYIPKKDQISWLPRLIWAVVLWQSFLGWWWWVGGGMGVGEVEEMLRREERRERKRRSRQAKRTVRKEKAQALWRNASETLRRTKNNAKQTDGSKGVDSPETNGSVRAEDASAPHIAGRESVSGSCSASTCGSPRPTTFLQRLQQSRPARCIRSWFTLLRQAHLTAAHEQAIERVERRQQAYGAETAMAAGDTTVVGWGLGSFGIREMERREMDRNDQELLRKEAGEEDSVHDDAPPRIPQRHAIPPLRVSTSTWSMWWWEPLRRWRLQDATTY